MRSFAWIALFWLAIGGVAPAAQPGSWDKIVSGASRFKVLKPFGDAAVLDKETGLVWERAVPSSNSAWAFGFFTCLNKTVGGRKGWRLPTAEELQTLVDPSLGFQLPTDHPFSVTYTGEFWTATADPEDSTRAFRLVAASGNVFTAPKGELRHIWCVRTGLGVQHGVD